MMIATKTCPYCGETIQSSATKCRFCGEWLTTNGARVGSKPSEPGTHDARAVTKGLKEKEKHDVYVGWMLFGAILLGSLVVVLTGQFLFGIIASIAVGAFAARWYFKE